MGYVHNFLELMDLNRKPTGSDEEWPPYTKEEPYYFILDAEESGLRRGPRSQACAFWNNFMPVITPGTASRKPFLHCIL